MKLSKIQNTVDQNNKPEIILKSEILSGNVNHPLFKKSKMQF